MSSTLVMHLIQSLTCEERNRSIMAEGGQRDHYKPTLSHQDAMAMKLMSAMVERDAAVQQRDVAINEKNAALAEREVVILHRDAAYAERNAAFTERDEAIAALQYARGNRITGIPNGPVVDSRSGSKHMSSDVSYQTRDSSPAEAYPTIPADVVLEVNPRRMKPSRKGPEAASGSKPSGPRKSKRLAAGEGLNEQLSVTKHKWNDQDMGLNQVRFDELTMPTPVCSCTGFRQPCYKWGNGGWQSACCTTTMSMYPLPCRPNKRRSRMSGRKMSGGAFNKVLNKLATEGHDLSMPLDLKDHWAKHGTNRYTTIK